MRGQTDLDDLVEHLQRTTRLDEGEARKVVDEALSFLRESLPEYVARRHSELRRAGRRNDEIYQLLIEEVAARPFAVPTLTERQVRRLIYG